MKATTIIFLFSSAIQTATSNMITRRVRNERQREWSSERFLSLHRSLFFNNACWKYSLNRVRCKEIRESAEIKCDTHHIQPLPNATPFAQDQGDLADHRIFHWYDGLEQALIVDLAGLQMHVGTREDPFHRAILRGESPVPTWNHVGNLALLLRFAESFAIDYVFACFEIEFLSLHTRDYNCRVCSGDNNRSWILNATINEKERRDEKIKRVSIFTFIISRCC